MPKKFSYHGLALEDLQKLPLDDFAKLLPSRQRRSLSRGFTPKQRKLIERVRAARISGKDTPIRTHSRDIVIIPEMLNLKFAVYNGKEFVLIDVKPEMVGHRLGEFAQTRKKVTHGTPGIGATRSSMYVPLK